MDVRCPGCATHYAVDVDSLRAAEGLARCLHCGALFDVSAGEIRDSDSYDRPDGAQPLILDTGQRVDALRSAARELPFEVPDGLDPIEPSDEAALDVADTLYQKPSYRGFVYGLLAMLLLLAFGAQLAWQYRDQLLARVPQLEIVCAHLPCKPTVVHEPTRYRILQRDIRPTDKEQGSLTLKANIRNDATAAQQLPDIQLSLLDNNGSVLIRRRLAPHEYLFPPPPDDRLVKPGEVFTIEIDFEDPGHIASGFTIDFF